MKPSQILIKAKANIDHPHKWIKDHMYVGDSLGTATRLCAIGAIYKVVNEIGPNDPKVNRRAHRATLALDVIVGQITNNVFYFASNYNDDRSTTHEDVMNMFDKAIEYAKKKYDRYYKE